MPVSPELLAATARAIADYRQGQIAAPTPAHVQRWIEQFPEGVREPLLTETLHILRKTYIPKTSVETFLNGLILNPKLTGGILPHFGAGSGLLDIQTAGHSQHEMIAVFKSLLAQHHGFATAACGANPLRYVYIDDGLFTGNRVLKDLKGWVEQHAPQASEVHVIVIALHSGGSHYVRQKLAAAAAAVEKQVDLRFWRIIELEDRRAYVHNSDVLRPTVLPNDPRTTAYAATFKHPIIYRTAGSVGGKQIFSSLAARELVEQEFLKAGTLIRELCPQLSIYQRPLGNTVLETLGFGSTIVTFRNCPNNAPLAFWAGHPWHPLFPRRTN